MRIFYKSDSINKRYTKKSLSTKDTKIILTIFISVLIDLLGFTIILPLFPSLFEYYEKSENDTLYRYVHSSVESFRNWLNVPSSEQHVTTVLFGGLLGSLFSFLQAGGCLFRVTMSRLSRFSSSLVQSLSF